jgi:hypothetical protein
VTPDDEKPPASTPPDREPPTLELAASEARPASDTATEPSPSEPWADTASDPLHSEQAASDQPPADQPPSDEPPPAEAAVPPPRVSWLPGGLLLIVAAIAGAGIVLAAVWAANLWLMPDNGVSEVDARLAALELQLRDLASSIPAAPDGAAADDISNRLAKLEAAGNPAAAPGDPTLGDRLAALQTELKALSETVAMLGRRNDEALAAAREARARADAAVAQLGPLSQKVAAAPVVDRNEVEALRNRIAALEQNDKALEDELAKRAAADSGDRAVKLALAATALRSVVERGDPFAAELATAKALAPDPKLLAPLEPFAAAGVPTAAALGRELADLAPALRASVAAPRESFLQRLQGNAEKLVRIRPAEEVAGNDTSAIVRRIEVKAANGDLTGDLTGALAELAQLPPPVRAPAEAWIKKAQARAAAVEASRRLAADALAGLGK